MEQTDSSQRGGAKGTVFKMVKGLATYDPQTQTPVWQWPKERGVGAVQVQAKGCMNGDTCNIVNNKNKEKIKQRKGSHRELILPIFRMMP